MPSPLLESHVAGFPCRRGKVRDVYDLGDRLVIVASDRISAFDWILPSGIPDKGRLLTAGTFAFPALLLIFALVHWLPLALIVLVGVGVAAIMIMNLANALVQTLVPDDLRGRVMSVYSMTFFGLMPLGALWIGAVAEYASPALAVILGALALFCVAALAWLFAPRIRTLE